jgi:monoamine oxidase
MHERNPVTRRRFVELAALAGSTAALPAPAFAAAASKRGRYDDGTDAIPRAAKGDPERVIVIGAGFAGLAAANALRSAGLECVVLEARDRIGGRAHTVAVDGHPVDLGCSWIHEPDGNVMTKVARQVGVARLPASPENDAATIRFLDDRTGLVPNAEALGEFAKSLEFDAQRAAISRELGPRATYPQGVERFLDRQGLQGDERRRVAYFQRLYAQLEDAQDWDRLPLGSQGKRHIPLPRPNHRPYTGDGGLGVFPKGGYERLYRALAGGTPIRLRHEVTRIAQSSRGVAVEVELGGGKRRRTRTLRGSHAIVTVPLGVLKAGAIRFESGLPAAKRGAIERIGFGQFEKVCVAFAEPFWEAGGTTHLIHLDADGGFRFPLTLDLQHFAGAPALIGLNAGAFAREIARGMSTRQARDRMMAMLRRAYGTDVPDPTDFAVTGWYADRHSRGAYSATILGTRPDDRTHLAAPVGGRVLFAGEATNLDGRPATADGALSSGIREAKRLLRSRKVTLTTR